VSAHFTNEEGVMDRRKILLILAAVVAALGTMLVWLYVRGAEGRVQAEYETVSVIVANQDIAPGESFTAASQAGKFEKRDVPKNVRLTGAQTDLSGLAGTVALTPIYSGEQVITAKWGGAGDVDVTAKVLAIPKGKVAVSVNLTDAARVSGFVTPGSQVAVLVAVAGGSGDKGYSQTLISPITVLGVGDTSTVTSTKTTNDGESTTQPIPQTLVTLAVTQHEAEQLLWASSYGALSFALVNKASDLGNTPRVAEQNLFQ
jgi:pilus assembly protein CpaB